MLYLNCLKDHNKSDTNVLDIIKDTGHWTLLVIQKLTW